MLFKLSCKNLKKSFKDYGIYFITLVLGVAIFYMFNSLDSQQAMLEVSQSTRELIRLMIDLLGMVSVFVAVILGLLIVYANNFLINRRKKEFGIYMSLGMGKRQISKIIFLETIFIGIISLIIGIVIGVFASQFMSVIVSKLFEADMSEFTFVFSQEACVKTCIYFAVMYLAVMFFNTITISRYKLISLLTAQKKNEQIKVKNPVLSIIVFLISVVTLTYCYWKVTADASSSIQNDEIMGIIVMGIVSTLLVFWSLSGFILKIVQTMKKVYLKGTNMFVLRQLNNKINTTIVSMSVICLMLFMTISILSSALSLRNSMQKDLLEMTPVDLNLYKSAYLPDSYTTRKGEKVNYLPETVEDSRIPIQESLKNNNFDLNLLKDITEISIYASNELKWSDFFGKSLDSIKKQFPQLAYNTAESIIKVSDYNKIARLYNQPQYELNDDEYVALCDFDSIANIRNIVLEDGNHFIQLAGKQYKSKYNKCQKGFVVMSTSHTNTGIILVPDNCNLLDEQKERYLLVANYNINALDNIGTKDDKEKKEYMENIVTTICSDYYEKGIPIDGLTKISLVEASLGVATIVTFIAIYLGIIFLIASAAILALKQLTESSDNKQRYTILRKIGCDEKMINKALFRQIGIFFALPLILAIIHSIFGIQFALFVLEGIANTEELIPSIIVTSIIIGVIYGVYFVATYLGSKRVIWDGSN